MAEREKLVERLTMRLEEPLMARLERHAQRLEATAGVRLSRAEVARKILEVGMSCIENGDNVANGANGDNVAT